MRWNFIFCKRKKLIRYVVSKINFTKVAYSTFAAVILLEIFARIWWKYSIHGLDSASVIFYWSSTSMVRVFLGARNLVSRYWPHWTTDRPAHSAWMGFEAAIIHTLHLFTNLWRVTYLYIDFIWGRDWSPLINMQYISLPIEFLLFVWDFMFLFREVVTDILLRAEALSRLL